MRRFEFVEGTSAKFWSADVEGNNFIIVFGRLGTPGQRKEKAFPTEDAAKRELEKKIAEKLREGYSEVSAAGAAAAPPAGAKGAAAASAKLALPPRRRGKEATTTTPTKTSSESVKAAAQALTALAEARVKRSWALSRRARIARRALAAVAGIDPTKDAALKSAWDTVMARVVAPNAKDRLPLTRALELLYEVDAAAFARAVRDTWKPAAGASPAAKAIAILDKQLDELDDPELALRVGSLLVDRPDRGSAASTEAGWKQRWKAVSPHLEAYLVKKGATLKTYLRGIDTAGDPVIARRIARMTA
jgi:predicted DNA-binding WGR domain protein